MDATDSSRQGNKTGSIRHWWGQSVRSAGGAGASPGSDGVRIDGVRGDRSVEHEARPPECGVRNAVSGRPHASRPADRPLPRRDVHFAFEGCTLHSRMTVGTALSSVKCTSRRRGRPGAVAATRAAHPGGRSDAVCPNLLQRPGSSRSAGRLFGWVVLKAWGVKVVVAVCSGGSFSSGGLLRRRPSASPRFASTAHLAWWDGVSHVVTRPVREIVT